MNKFDGMVSFQKQKSTQRMIEMLNVIEELKRSKATFGSLTIFAKEIARQLSRKEGKKVSSTTLIRNGSPYRAEVEQSFDELYGNKINQKSEIQAIAEFKAQLRLKNDEVNALNEEILSLKRNISNLLTENVRLNGERVASVTDQLPIKTPVNEVYFEYLITLFRFFCAPNGVYLFNDELGQIEDPLQGNVMKSFPDGFLEWNRKLKNK